MESLEGKRIVVMGGSHGLGLMVESFSARGAKVTALGTGVEPMDGIR